VIWSAPDDDALAAVYRAMAEEVAAALGQREGAEHDRRGERPDQASVPGVTRSNRIAVDELAARFTK